MATNPTHEARKAARLAGLRNRSTKYEVVITHEDGRKFRVGYGRKTLPGVLRLVNVYATKLVTFTGSDHITVLDRAGRKLGAYARIGSWTIRTTGRTEREAIISGELAWFGEAV